MLVFALAGLVLPSAAHRGRRRSSMALRASQKAYSEEFLDALQGLATLKAFGQSAARGRMLADRAVAMSRDTIRVLAMSLSSRGVADFVVASGAAVSLALGAYRVSHGLMSLQALLIILMAGTEIFRPLRDLRTVLHQGLVGQAAAIGITALIDAEAPALPGTGTGPVSLEPTIAFEDVRFGVPRPARHRP